MGVVLETTPGTFWIHIVILLGIVMTNPYKSYLTFQCQKISMYISKDFCFFRMEKRPKRLNIRNP